MKKKLLNFLLAICLLIPCGFGLSACGDESSSSPPGLTTSTVHCDLPQDIQVGALPGHDDWVISIANYYDASTLSVTFDDEPIEITLYDNIAFDELPINNEIREVASFDFSEYEDRVGEHVLKCTAEEREISLKIVSAGQTFTKKELNIMDDYNFDGMGDISIKDMLDSNHVAKTTYTELVDNLSVGLSCKKKIGYYKHPFIFEGINSHIYYALIQSDNQPKPYIMCTSEHEIPSDGIIEITLNKENLQVSEFTVSGFNLGVTRDTILSIWVNGERYTEDYYGYSFMADQHDDDIRIYIEPYEGVSFTNVKMYVNDTLMTINYDSEKGKSYITIPTNSLPNEFLELNTYGDMDYNYYHTEEVLKTIFEVKIKDVEVPNTCDLMNNLDFNVTTNHAKVFASGSGQDYYSIEDVYYDEDYEGIKTYYYPNRLAQVGFIFDDDWNNQEESPCTFKFNGHTIEITNLVKKLPDPEVYNGSVDPESPNFYNCYFIEIDGGNNHLFQVSFRKNSNDIDIITFYFEPDGNSVTASLIF